MDLVTALKTLDSIRNSDEPRLLYGARKRQAIVNGKYATDAGAVRRVEWAHRTYSQVMDLVRKSQAEFERANPHDKFSDSDTDQFLFFFYTFFKLNLKSAKPKGDL